MTLEEQLESFYVDAGLTDEAIRAELAPEGDVERWLGQARLRLGPLDRRVVSVAWAAGDSQVSLPADCDSVARILVTQGAMPVYDEWGQALAFRTVATSAGAANVFYTAYFDLPSEGPRASDPKADAAALSFVSYALSRFFRKLAGSRADFRRYATITGQAGIEAQDLRDLADDYLGEFQAARDDLDEQPPASFYGD